MVGNKEREQQGRKDGPHLQQETKDNSSKRVSAQNPLCSSGTRDFEKKKPPTVSEDEEFALQQLAGWDMI